MGAGAVTRVNYPTVLLALTHVSIQGFKHAQADGCSVAARSVRLLSLPKKKEEGQSWVSGWGDVSMFSCVCSCLLCRCFQRGEERRGEESLLGVLDGNARVD